MLYSAKFSQIVEAAKSNVRAHSIDLYVLVQEFHSVALKQCYSLDLADEMLVSLLGEFDESIEEFMRKTVWESRTGQVVEFSV